MAEKLWEDYYLKNPAGQLDALMGAAEYIRDERTRKLLELSQQGQITTPQIGGYSTAAMDDLLGTPQPTMQTPGVQLPNRAASALAGSVGGAMSADAASAGSPMEPPPGYPGMGR
jgi:hypothetical protein